MLLLLAPTSCFVPFSSDLRVRHSFRQPGRSHQVHARCSRQTDDLVQVEPDHHSAQSLSPTRRLSQTLLTALWAAGVCDTVQAAEVASGTQPYVPGPVNIGWEIWAGAVAGVIPFIIGAYQFTARILIQRRCETCGGSGLVQKGRFQRKCQECGGFFPWQGWKQFLTSTAAPGNGGVLRQPRDQKGVIYRVPAKKPEQEAKE